MRLALPQFTTTAAALSLLTLSQTFLRAISSETTVTGSRNNPDKFFGGQGHNEEYLDWVATVRDSHKSALYLPNTVDPNQGIAIHWSISSNDDTGEPEYLELGLAVRASGWFGFGLSQNGGMTGSDMLLYEPGKNPRIVTDAYVLQDRRMPETDDCQDWQLVSSNFVAGDNAGVIQQQQQLQQPESDFLMIQVRRKLNTGDTQDLDIYNDASTDMPVHRVIAAWGNELEAGTSYHGSRTARGAIRFFSEVGDEEQVFLENMRAASDGSFLVGTKGPYNVKPIDTEYAKFCTTADDLRAAGVPIDQEGFLSLIGFEPIVDSVEHVHHFIIMASFSEHNNITTNDQCANATEYSDMVYPWAPGDPPLALPENVGFALGNGGYLSFQIEIHYDNPLLKQGVMDNSGVQFYYSLEPREHTAGFLIVGDSTVALEGQPIARGLTDYDFHCPGECSTMALTDPTDNSTSSVTVVREYIHMHQSGTSAYNQHIRDGEVVRTGKVEYFAFEQQGAQIVQQEPFEILPGDSFHTRCFFQNDNDDRTFGLASSDEMCMAFLLYYPRKSIAGTGVPWVCAIGMEEAGLPACESTFEQDILSSVDTSRAVMQRTFGAPSTECRAETDSGSMAESTETSAAMTFAGGIGLTAVLGVVLTVAASLFL